MLVVIIPDNYYCWFSRVHCSINTNGRGASPAPNGGIIQIVTDFRNPASISGIIIILVFKRNRMLTVITHFGLQLLILYLQ